MVRVEMKPKEKVTDVIDRWVVDDKDNIALQVLRGNRWERYTYEQMDKAVSKTVAYFKNLQLQPSSRVVILAQNSPLWVITLLAVLKCECTAVLLEPRMENEDLKILIRRADAQMIITTKDHEILIDKDIEQHTPTLDILHDFEYFDRSLKGLVLCPPSTSDGDSEVACLLFTSGTTGDYKGVLITYNNMALVIRDASNLAHVCHEDQMLAMLPTTHIYGLVFTILAPLSQGSTITFVESLEKELIFRTLKEAHPTILLCVPRVLELFHATIKKEFSKRPPFLRKFLENMSRFCGWFREKTGINLGRTAFKVVHDVFGGKITRYVSGGASLNSEIHAELEAMGFTIIEGYGLTETCCLLTCNDMYRRKIGSVGHVIDGVEVMIANPDSNGVGEICARGANIMKGYFRESKATSKMIRDGWLHTGDLGKFDTDQNLHITGRIKEIIICSNGENVMPTFVESKYAGISNVEELAVVGLKDPSHKKGEEIHAAVVLSKGISDVQAAKKEVMLQIADRSEVLPFELQIRHIHFVDAIPKTTTLKVKRKLLAEQLMPDKELVEEEIGTPEVGEQRQQVIRELVIGVIKDVMETSRGESVPQDIDIDSFLQFDLDFDSLMFMELLHQAREKLKISIPQVDIRKLKTVKDIIELVERMDSHAVSEAGWVLTVKDYLKNPDHFPSAGDLGIKGGVWKSLKLKGLLSWYRRQFNVKVTGKENLNSLRGACVIYSNHCSHMDSLCLVDALQLKPEDYVIFERDDCFDSKGVPKSHLLSSLNALSFPPEMDSAEILDTVKNFKALSDQGKKVIIFPEGGLSRNGKIQPFRTFVGMVAKEMEFTFLPVYLDGTFEALPEGKTVPQSGEINIIIGEPFTMEALPEIEGNWELLSYHQITDLLKSKIEKLKAFYEVFKGRHLQ